MADSNVRRLKDKAFALFEKQKFDEALEIYSTLLRRAPNDTAILLKVGELNHMLGHNKAAITVYTRAADLFAKKGLMLKGIAVCKLIREIDPGRKAGVAQLTELYNAHYGSIPPPAHKSILASLTPKKHVAASLPIDDADDEEDNDDIPLEIEVDLTELTAPSASRLSGIPLFSDLEETAFVDMLKRVPLHHFDAGEVVVTEGEMGSSFFILVDGAAQIIKSPYITLAKLGSGAFFGEMAIIAAHRRRASVITTEPSQILEISRRDLDELTRVHPHIFSVLTKFTEERLLQNLTVTSPLFSPFPPKERAAMLSRFRRVKFLAGQNIITQGDEATGLYIIISGSAEIETDLGITSILSEGEMFGETALLLHADYSATVRAKENTRALFLPRAAFNELIMTHPQVLELVSELKEDRIDLPAHRSSLPRDLFSDLDGGSVLL